MPKNDAIPTADDIIGPAIDAIVARRPKALRWLNHYELTRTDGARSRYATVVGAWRAQAIVACNRLASELAARFLDTASGQGLRELVSEPDFGSLTLDETASFAYGTAILHRALDGGAAPPIVTLPPGIIPAGTRFKRNANPSAVPIPLAAAEYVTTAAAVVDSAATSVSVPIVAVRAGTDANVVPESGVTGIAGVTIASRLYDVEQAIPTEAKWVLFSFDAGGGSAGLVDDDLRRIARGQAGGLQGPTTSAIRAGTLRTAGVNRIAIFNSRIDDDASARPNTRVFIVDDSWATSSVFRAGVTQFLQDNWAGFGCRITAGQVFNTYIRVECTVQLRNARKLTDTTQIAADIRAAIKAYFDDRDDWYQWNLGQLRAVISNASRDILTCTSATVKNRTGVAIVAPVVDEGTDTVLQHYYLLGDGVTPTFTGPS